MTLPYGMQFNWMFARKLFCRQLKFVRSLKEMVVACSWHAAQKVVIPRLGVGAGCLEPYGIWMQLLGIMSDAGYDENLFPL